MCRSELTWQHRPNVDVLAELLKKYLDWDAEKVRAKLMPLLLDWDASHRNHPDNGNVTSFLSRSVGLTKIVLAEFEVCEVVSLGTKGRQLGNQTSQITVRFRRKADVQIDTRDADIQYLEEKMDGGKWNLRKPLIDSFYPDLIREFKKRKGKKNDASMPSRKITDFFKEKNKTRAFPADAPAESDPVRPLSSSPYTILGVQEVDKGEALAEPPPCKIPKLSIWPEACEKRTDMPPRLKRTGVVDYPITRTTPAKKPFSVNRILRKRLNDVHEDTRQYRSPVKKTRERFEDQKNNKGPISPKKRSVVMHKDIRQYCSPVKQAKETFEEKGNDRGPISLISSLGSVPRRLTTLSIDSPVERPHPPWHVPVHDDVTQTCRPDNDVAVSIGSTPLLPVIPSLTIEEEVVDLLTPRTHNDVTVEDAVIDLLSEPSPRP